MVHEPFADAYWKGWSATEKLNQLMQLIAESKKPVFVKDIAHHLPHSIATNKALISSFSHIILVREPLAAFHSHLKVNPEVKAHEFGYKALFQMAASIKEITGQAAYILLSEDLTKDPSQSVETLCKHFAIPHLEQALSWQAKSHKDWRAAQKWQAKAAASTGFEASERKEYKPLDKSLKDIFEHHQGYYLRLKKMAENQQV